jgi:CRISPR-associated protein Cmr1
MGKIVFECETLTPLFMYGADGKTPELRPASIKGLMRFWWRAINGDLPLDKFREQEAEIFGSTEKKSKLIIFPIEIIEEKDYKISLTPHHKKEYCSQDNKNCFFKHDKCMKANKKTGKLYTFKIQMLLKNNPYLNNDKLINLFKTVTILGGFGQRSRRGFGSARIKRIDENEVLSSLGEITNFINTIPKFQNSAIKYPYIKAIDEKGKQYYSFKELLETIGEASHDYDCDDLGYAKKNNRLASPIYVSILKFSDNDFRPIITTLNNTKNGDNQDENVENFIRKIKNV